MKRKTIFTALSFLLTLGFAGCSQEEVTQPEQEIRVATRSTGEGEVFTNDFTINSKLKSEIFTVIITVIAALTESDSMEHIRT